MNKNEKNITLIKKNDDGVYLSFWPAFIIMLLYTYLRIQDSNMVKEYQKSQEKIYVTMREMVKENQEVENRRTEWLMYMCEQLRMSPSDRDIKSNE